MSTESTPAGSGLAPGIPPLPENATPEQKDHHWYTHVYQGDSMPQLTLRAVVMGGILGMLMSLSNLYTTVKLGWAFGVAITACVLSFVAWNAIRAISGGRLRQMSILENNCMASTASAAGYSTGGTVGTAFGALLLITGEHERWPVLACFVLLVATMGVFLAIPMKRQMINQEQLPFPTGIATAETLRSLYSKGVEAKEKAVSLLVAMIAGGLLAFFRVYGGLIAELEKVGKAPGWLKQFGETVRVPEHVDLPSRWIVAKGKVQGWCFEPSALLVAAGMIVGPRVSFSMLFGSLLLYIGFVPTLFGHDQRNSLVEGFVRSFTYAADSGNFNPIRWSLWTGTSLMVFSSLTAVAIQWKTIVRAFRIGGGGTRGVASADLNRIEVPFSWLIIGMIPIGLGLIVLQYYAFAMSPLLGTISVIMSFPLALVACRATGETDTTPIGPMGKITQLLYAILAKQNTVVNLTSAGVTAGAAGASADLLTDLKSGYLLGANPRRQFVAQFIGCFFGTLMVVPAWYLMFPDKQALESYDPPAANMWRAFAEALTQGLNSVPRTAQLGIVVGGLIGIAMPLFETFILPKKYRKYFPSVTGIGLSWVVPFQNSLSFALGAVITWLWGLLKPKSAEKHNVPIASGLIAGESLLAAFIAIAATAVGLIWTATAE